MTSLLERRKGAGSKELVVAPFPQVNLLPNEILIARGLKVVKRLLALAVIAVIAVLMLAIAWMFLGEKNATADLDAAKDHTEELRIEEEKYAEVPIVMNALATAQGARLLGFSTEVMWRAHLEAISAVLPEGISIAQITMSGATPTTPAAVPATPLQQPSVDILNLTLRSLTVPTTADLILALDGVPGLGDAWVSSATIGEAEDGTVFYDVIASVQVRDAALANRFLTEESAQ